MRPSPNPVVPPTTGKILEATGFLAVAHDPAHPKIIEEEQ